MTVSYEDPSSDDDPAALQRSTGEDAPPFDSSTATNNFSLGLPMPLSARAEPLDRMIVVTFDETMQYARADRSRASDYTVHADGRPVGVSRYLQGYGSGRSKVLVYPDSRIRPGQTVTVGYEGPSSVDDAVAIQNKSGEDAESFSRLPVTNESIVEPSTYTVGPAQVSAEVAADGGSVTVTFDEAVNKSTLGRQ